MPNSPVGLYSYKLLIAGSGGSGKTALLQRYTTGHFSGSTKSTIGVDFAVTSVNNKYGNCKIQIWDFGGEQQFRFMLPSFCLGASGSLLLFDPLRPDTFYELDEWLKIIRTNTKNIPILLLCSKQDLLDEGHPLSIPQEDIDNFINDNQLDGYLQISSKTGLNVIEAFTMLSEFMVVRSKAGSTDSNDN